MLCCCYTRTPANCCINCCCRSSRQLTDSYAGCWFCDAIPRCRDASMPRCLYWKPTKLLPGENDGPEAPEADHVRISPKVREAACAWEEWQPVEVCEAAWCQHIEELPVVLVAGTPSYTGCRNSQLYWLQELPFILVTPRDAWLR